MSVRPTELMRMDAQKYVKLNRSRQRERRGLHLVEELVSGRFTRTVPGALDAPIFELQT